MLIPVDPLSEAQSSQILQFSRNRNSESQLLGSEMLAKRMPQISIKQNSHEHEPQTALTFRNQMRK